MNQGMNIDPQAAQTIAEIASDGNAFSMLAAALKEAGLADTLAGAGPFTLFLPSDVAFKKLPHGAIESLMKDQAKLRNVLSYHIVYGQTFAKQFKPGDLKTMEGSSINVKISGGSIEVNGARILGADVKATNGVVHIIDAVLFPKRARPTGSSA